MKNRTGFISLLTLLFVAALAYLPLINQIGYTHDDWYLMASARAEGSGVFHTIYSVDRPLRAYILGLAYELFGQNVLLYNLSAWFFRILSAVVFLWLLRMLWPGRSTWTWLTAILYLIYPGFLSQLNGIDYQSQILSLALAMLSVALTVAMYFQKNTVYKVMGGSLSILLGLLYLGLVEYEAGFELMRLTILFILVGRVTQNFRDRMIATIKLDPLFYYSAWIWNLACVHLSGGAPGNRCRCPVRAVNALSPADHVWLVCTGHSGPV